MFTITEKTRLIDLGIKDFAIVSNGTIKKNINKTARLKKLEKQLKKEQRCLSRKYEDFKKNAIKSRKETLPDKIYKNRS